MVFPKNALLSALKQVMPGADSGNAILAGADTVIFKEGALHTFNDQMSVTVPFSIEGESLPPAAFKVKELFDLVSRLPGDVIKVLPEEKTWTIKAGAAKAEMVLLESSIVTQVEGTAPASKWKKLPEKFLKGVQECLFGTNASALEGTFVGEGAICSTDEMRINWYALEENMPSFWISGKSSSELCKIPGLVEYQLSEEWAHFRNQDKVIFSAKRLAHSKYPYEAIKSIVESCEPTKKDVQGTLPAKFSDAVSRAAALSTIIEVYDAVRVTFSPEGIEVFSKRSTGKYQEKLAWDTPPSAAFEPKVIFADSVMLQNALSKSSKFLIKESEEAGTRLVFSGDGVLHLVGLIDGSEA